MSMLRSEGRENDEIKRYHVWSMGTGLFDRPSRFECYDYSREMTRYDMYHTGKFTVLRLINPFSYLLMLISNMRDVILYVAFSCNGPHRYRG